jgi:type VI protein secretion system component VasF
LIQGEPEQNEIEKLRLETVEELRKVREDLKQSNLSNQELIAEMR